MSVRGDLRAALVTAIAAATGLAAGTWDGEEAVFNSAHAWPGIAVAYAGVDFGESLEIGAATYSRAHLFHVFVFAATAGATGGDVTAMGLLEDIEKTVAGQLLAAAGLAEIVGEELVQAHMGRFLYVQTWRLEMVESH